MVPRKSPLSSYVDLKSVSQILDQQECPTDDTHTHTELPLKRPMRREARMSADSMIPIPTPDDCVLLSSDPLEDQYEYWLHQCGTQGRSVMDMVASTGSIQDVIQLIHYSFQTDRVVETWTLHIIVEFWGAFPEAARHLLTLFQQYASWQQLLVLLELVKSSRKMSRDVSNAVYNMLREQSARDVRTLSSNKKGLPWDLDHGIPLPNTTLDHTLDSTGIATPTYPNGTNSRDIDQRQQQKALIRSAVRKQRGGILRRIKRTKGTSRVVSRQDMAVHIPTFGTPVLHVPNPHTESHRFVLPRGSVSGVMMSDIEIPLEGRIDEFLYDQPLVRKTRDMLLEIPLRRFDASSTTERVLYIHQGEVGHATSVHTDVIMSDRATTCHILSIQSTVTLSQGSTRVPSLVSLTHLDANIYTDCIIEMIQQHIDHHTNTPVHEPLQLIVDVVGGFDDSRGASARISCWLLNLLKCLAIEYEDLLTMTLRTCMISCLNDDGAQSPIGRGMGIDLRSGEVFLASSDLSMAPAMQLRNARIWAGGGHGRLAVVHTPCTSDRLTIQPFEFAVFDNLPKYLRMSDSKMIRHTSTSPDVEEEDFCRSVRNTLRFMQAIECQKVFGPDLNQPLSFERIDSSNVWRRCNDVL